MAKPNRRCSRVFIDFGGPLQPRDSRRAAARSTGTRFSDSGRANPE
jgi:hypothetical protein